MNLQTKAVESVQQRGFWQEENIPAAAWDTTIVEEWQLEVIDVGDETRSLRKAVKEEFPFYKRRAAAHTALLNAQTFRLVEETREVVASVHDSQFNREQFDTNELATELADVLIVLYQIAQLQGVDLEASVLDKLAADEKRGHLHGQGVTA